MIDHIQAFSAVGKLDNMLYEILQTRHELSQAIHQIVLSPLEEGKGYFLDITV